ncbi:MAG: hypothetical protein ACXV8I_10615 [Methylobacter sp.]
MLGFVPQPNLLADDLIKSTEKILSSFEDATKEMTPYIERMFDKINRKSEAFDAKKDQLNKEIDNAVRRIL